MGLLRDEIRFLLMELMLQQAHGQDPALVEAMQAKVEEYRARGLG